ncbi:MAG TPA: YncE family protein [Methylomirabilota bacterium]|nr:YncE family protein [Methylomirabilota bacterium]
MKTWHALVCCFLALTFTSTLRAAGDERRLLYVAAPGIRNYLEYGGHGLLVFDMDHGHRFVKRIKTSGLDSQGKPLNVKGVCASASLKRIYITTTRTMTCLDLVTEKILWEKSYPNGCDRMSISPDGKTIYVPSLEGAQWHVVDAENGNVVAKVVPNSGAHNTVYGSDGTRVYLAGLRSPWLTVADTKTHISNTAVGPFSAPIRPFTVNAAQTYCFCCVNELLGFEVGDIKSGKMIHRVTVPGFEKGAVKRHGCPSHGVGLTPDEKEVWVTDGANNRMHVFDISALSPANAPRYVSSIEVRDQPGWITFSLDGAFAYPSTGDVIDVKSRKIIAQLTDETGAAVQSEKLLEIDFRGTDPVRTGDQFGIGRKR